MRVIELAEVLDERRPVILIRMCYEYFMAEFDSIYSVDIRFADEDVISIDFNVDDRRFEIYI